MRPKSQSWQVIELGFELGSLPPGIMILVMMHRIVRVLYFVLDGQEVPLKRKVIKAEIEKMRVLRVK